MSIRPSVSKANERKGGEEEILATDSLIHPPLTRPTPPNHRPICVTYKHKKRFGVSYIENCFFFFFELFYKLPITGSNYSNVTGATLLKFLSVVDISFEYFRNLEIIFVKNTSETLLLQLFSQWKLKVLMRNHHSNFLRKLAKRFRSFWFMFHFPYLFWRFNFFF